MNGLQRNIVIVFSSVIDTAAIPAWLTVFKGKLYPFSTHSPYETTKGKYHSAQRNWKIHVKVSLAPNLKNAGF